MSRKKMLFDAQWVRILPLLPTSDGKRGTKMHDHRPLVDGHHLPVPLWDRVA